MGAAGERPVGDRLGWRARARRVAIAFMSMACVAPASAFELNRLQAATQAELGRLAEDLTAAYQFHPSGFGLRAGARALRAGPSGGLTFVEHADTWEQVLRQDIQAIGHAGAVARWRLSPTVDIGGLVAAIPESSAQLFGLEAGWRFSPSDLQGVSVVVRTATALVTEVDDFGIGSQTLDATLMARIGDWQPYAGAGLAYGLVRAHDSSGLDDETVWLPRLHGGVGRWIGAWGMAGELQLTPGTIGASLRMEFGV